MNAAICGAVIAAEQRNIEVIGVRNGFDGLLEEQFLPLSSSRVRGINSLGGTILGLRGVIDSCFLNGDGECQIRFPLLASTGS